MNDKLSSEAKQISSESAVHPDVSGWRDEIDVLVHVRREPSADDSARLKAVGASVRTIAGDVLTARIAVEHLEALGDLDVVRHVEIRRPLAKEARLSCREQRLGEDADGHDVG